MILCHQIILTVHPHLHLKALWLAQSHRPLAFLGFYSVVLAVRCRSNRFRDFQQHRLQIVCTHRAFYLFHVCILALSTCKKPVILVQIPKSIKKVTSSEQARPTKEGGRSRRTPIIFPPPCSIG